jgi:hypothetical protein
MLALVLVRRRDCSPGELAISRTEIGGDRWGNKWGNTPHRSQPIPADLDLAKTA